MWRLSHPKVAQLPGACCETATDLAQQLGFTQVAKQHTNQLVPTGEPLGVSITPVLPNESGELLPTDDQAGLPFVQKYLYLWMSYDAPACECIGGFTLPIYHLLEFLFRTGLIESCP